MFASPVKNVNRRLNLKVADGLQKSTQVPDTFLFRAQLRFFRLINGK